jgi:hypothetical protein
MELRGLCAANVDIWWQDGESAANAKGRTGNLLAFFQSKLRVKIRPADGTNQSDPGTISRVTV